MNPFQHIIDEAKRWVGPSWKFVEIEDVRWVKSTGGGLWYPPHGQTKTARIECGWDHTAEMVWHESFHSVFHGSPMAKYDGWWGEGWCNAFSDSNHRKFRFVTRAVMDDPKTMHEQRYLVPAQKLLQCVGYDRERLRALWLQWNESPQLDGAFSRFMDYHPS